MQDVKVSLMSAFLFYIVNILKIIFLTFSLIDDVKLKLLSTYFSVSYN